MKTDRTSWRCSPAALALGLAFALGGSVFAETLPQLTTCEGGAQTPACKAVRGDRAEGWTAQSRAEVCAQHGMVTTSQPLAAQAGLQVLKQGGNASMWRLQRRPC